MIIIVDTILAPFVNTVVVNQGCEYAIYSKDLTSTLSSNKKMEEALRRIAKWHGEFPRTGEKHPNGEEMSYVYRFGFDGERDFMRKLAEEALE